jgi:hypothetical protein
MGGEKGGEQAHEPEKNDDGSSEDAELMPPYDSGVDHQNIFDSIKSHRLCSLRGGRE